MVVSSLLLRIGREGDEGKDGKQNKKLRRKTENKHCKGDTKKFYDRVIHQTCSLPAFSFFLHQKYYTAVNTIPTFFFIEC